MSGIELYRPLLRAGLFVALTFAVGVAGYLVIGGEEYGWIDAIYMTAITLTTVGYAEVIDLSQNPGGRLFTTLLLFLGVGAFLYFFSAVTAFLVEGHVQRLLWRRRMDNTIKSLSGHTIVCGGGHTGRHVVQELVRTQRAFVLIDDSEEQVEALTAKLGIEFPVVIGDATDDDNLLAAGIERAHGLIACISSDKDNLIVTISARILRPQLRIICRCIEEKVEDKIRRAGADAVISPNQIGGLRMISEMVRPAAVSLMDLMLREHDTPIRIESTGIEADSALAGQTIGDLRQRGIRDLLILAMRDQEGTWAFSPADRVPLVAGASLIFMASPEARRAVEELAGMAG